MRSGPRQTGRTLVAMAGIKDEGLFVVPNVAMKRHCEQLIIKHSLWLKPNQIVVYENPRQIENELRGVNQDSVVWDHTCVEMGTPFWWRRI